MKKKRKEYILKKLEFDKRMISIKKYVLRKKKKEKGLKRVARSVKIYI